VDADRESFVRWQANAREQFSSVSNLVLGLSTGLLAFLTSGLVSPNTASTCMLIISVASLAALTGSIALGVWCSINRLRDFRATAQIARSRCNGDLVESEARADTKVIGNRSWQLFYCQVTLFVVGSVGLAISVLDRLW
jgi:hypothetical protein